MVKYDESVTKPSRFVAMMGLTVEEFQALVAPFERAWLSQPDAWKLDGTRWTGRDDSRYRTAALPRAKDKLRFILIYLEQVPTKEGQGQLFDMSRSNITT
ncbi:MAG TPA: hypothetical protein DEP84_10180 [Chloroflexi bacterium]|nr:hypothetical protein [Chloroflexota bacterium]